MDRNNVEEYKMLEKLLASIREAALTFPDQRLGQIISNAIPPGVDIFHVGDEELMNRIRDYVDRKGGT